MFSLAALRHIHDLGSGLNVYRLAALRTFYYKTFPDDLTFNYIMLLGSYQAVHGVRFFPISWREDDQVSNVKLVRQAFKVLALLAGFMLRRRAFLSREMRARPFAAYSGKIVYRCGPKA